MSNLMFVVPNFPGKEKAAGLIAKAGIRVAKHSPEICLGVGIAAGVGATVLACRSTLKVGAIFDDYKETMDNINFLKDKAERGEQFKDYDLETAQRDKFILIIQTAVKVGKLYAPAILAGAVSIGFLLGGHHIMMKRQAALTVAYTALQKVYDSYRDRVRDVVGEEKEMDIYRGVRERVEESVNEKGKVTKKKVTDLEQPASPYTRIFDEASCWWSKDAETNKFFLSLQQKHANDLLKVRGHLFLNEVFDMLDLPRTKMGAVCGWVYGDGDSFVDFGMWDATKAGVRNFINGAERSIWLDFNCDGVIYDLI